MKHDVKTVKHGNPRVVPRRRRLEVGGYTEAETGRGRVEV